MYRTNISFFMRFLNEVIVYMLGNSVIDNSKKFIADGKQFNENYIESTFDAFSNIYMGLIIG